METVIKVKNIWKDFKIYYDKGSTLKEKILFKNRNRHEVHTVLRGVNFEIKRGEVVGLIGENGSGKSTLLKLMTRIIYPNKGTIEIKGKVSSLLELGAGFHPDMTGRENIYTNASIFGLKKSEIDERLERIIEFSELGEFIDNPVRTYSSGMYMRLAFSVAINVDADILLVDEILAVGDASFQAKCFNKMQEIKAEGKTIVIVSHDTGSIERLCDRAIWIDQGIKKKDGLPHDVIALYLDKIMNKDIHENTDENEKVEKNSNDKHEKIVNKNENRTGNRYLEIKNIKMADYS
ncbi:ABC transporter ATP-binding protein, partial [Clostridium butyricum]